MSVYKPKFRPYDEVLSSAKRRVPTLSQSFYNEIPQEMRRYAFTVSSIERVSEVQDILESLNRAFEENKPFDQWKQEFNIKSFRDLADNRKELIFRMHSQTAYNQGHYQVGIENKEDLPWMKYQAIGDERTRPNHMANDGITRPVEDEFWEQNLPPIGFNCRCFTVNVPKSETDRETLTPPSKLKSMANEIRPDVGFRYNKLDPTKTMDRYLQKKIKTLPPELRDSMLKHIEKRDLDTDIWWERNKQYFE